MERAGYSVGQLVVATFTASLVPAVVFCVASSIHDPSFITWLVLFFPATLLVTAANSLMLLLPFFIFLNRRVKVTWWAFGGIGFMIGYACILLPELYLKGEMQDDAWLPAAMCGGLGMLGALAFVTLLSLVRVEKTART